MPWGPLQITPPGFLGFLNLKNEGKNPREIPEDLTPTIELRNWYLNATAQAMSATNATVSLLNNQDGFALPSAGNIVVPSGEWWYVHSMLVWAVLPAAVTEFLAMSPAWVEPNNFIDFEVLSPPAPLLQGVAGATRRYFNTARDFWVPPGSALCWHVLTAETATSIPAFLNGRITVLPI